MADVAVSGEDESFNANVKTTVKFLREVYESGFQNYSSLRSYLLTKDMLAESEIAEAFRIHQDWVKNLEEPKNKVLAELEVKNSMLLEPSNRQRKLKEWANGNILNQISFLLEERKADGISLLKKFLQNEVKYYKKLECVCDEYYSNLIELSDKRKFDMTHQEVEQIFELVPHLLKFHKHTFYPHLRKGTNIMKLFLHFFKIFAGYVDYTKGCSSTVKKMRNYTSDKKLHKHLWRIKLKSKQPRDDMIDLLLVPIVRMSDYKQFLECLQAWADEKQTASYELICKASRRIGRVANHLEKYQSDIFNMSEMNKVQEFLKSEWDVSFPNRRILRRGVMFRLKTRWTTRKKPYMFFLFNDVLLYSTRNGERQKVVTLKNCEVTKKDSKRKLQLVCRGLKKTELHLECTNVQERNKWFEAIAKSIDEEKARVRRNFLSESQELKGPTPWFVNEDIESNSSNSGQSCEKRLGDNNVLLVPGTPMAENSDYRDDNSLYIPSVQCKDVDVSLSISRDEPKPAVSVGFSSFHMNEGSKEYDQRKGGKIRRALTLGTLTNDYIKLIRITEDEKKIDENEDDSTDISFALKCNPSEYNNIMESKRSSIINGYLCPLKETEMIATATVEIENVPGIQVCLSDF